MNKTIKKIFLLCFILQNSIIKASSEKNSKKFNKTKKNHGTSYVMPQPTNQKNLQPNTNQQGMMTSNSGQSTQPGMINNENFAQTQTNMPQTNNPNLTTPMIAATPINYTQQNNNMTPQYQQQPQTINYQQMPLMGRPSDETMRIASHQISTDGRSMTIVEELNPIKAAKLVADIATLKENFKIISTILYETVHKSILMNPKPTSKFTYRLDERAFDPTKEILNPNGGFINGVVPQAVAINPYNGKPVTLNDLRHLQETRKLYLNIIQLMLLILGDIVTNEWNVKQIHKYIPLETRQKIWNLNIQPKAYGFNLARPIWKIAIDYVADGKLKIKYIN
jgi:hypothetical protein